MYTVLSIWLKHFKGIKDFIILKAAVATCFIRYCAVDSKITKQELRKL